MKIIYTKKFPGIIFVFLLIQVSAFSQTWNGSTSTNWNTAANWTPNTVPTSASDVIINTSAGNQPNCKMPLALTALI